MKDLCIALVSPDGSSAALLYNLVVLVPDVLFLIFLAINARRSYDILTRNPSMTMWTYYILVWAVCLVNFLHTSLQLTGRNSEGQDGSEHTHWWNLAWLFTRFVMMMLEVSIIVFLLHGYIGSAFVMLRRTAVLSGAISLSDALIKAVLIWGLGVPLYQFGGSSIGDATGDMTWSKWGFWMVHAIVFAAAYLVMLVLPFTKWRDLLPSKDTFHYYVRILFSVNLIATIGAMMIGLHIGFGYCLYGLTNTAYLGLYAPLLYITFLASFFQSDDVDLENYYYSEMSEAGFLDFGDAEDPFIGP